MSVIENAIKKLQASRAGHVAARAKEHALAAAGRRRETAQEAPAAVPGRAIAINLDALRLAGLLPPLHQERELAQQFRHIKRPLINNALGRGVAPVEQGNVLMIASAVPGEGKTFTSLNLALSMRLEEDLTVLLVDGDVVNPRLSRVLGVEGQPGLLDLLRDPDLSIGSVILSTDLPGLSFLPAGRPDQNATELLSSVRMRDVATLLGGHDPARMVLFDSPPILLATESQALAHLAGQILVVVKADQTQQQVVLDALGNLEEGKPVSLVLNQTMRQPGPGYYYQYGSAAPGEKPGGA